MSDRISTILSIATARAIAAVALTMAVCASAAVGQRSARSISEAPRGDVRGVHDPTIVKEGGVYYLFSTRAGIALRCSEDLVRWRLCGDVFPHLPGWAVEAVPGLRGIWAPDVEFFNGKFHLYYSASTFGSNRSSIGLVTIESLDPSSSKHRWKDEGKVIASTPSDDWNAIDPNVVIDDEGTPWLAFGSFWSGIKMRRLDPATGKLDPADETLYALAERPRSKVEPGAVEAPFVFRKNGYYYLFVSFDHCCRGRESTYNIRVGRARKVTGPYLDRDGKDMRAGGGTLVVVGTARWRGPGHGDVLSEGGRDMLVYHAYDAEHRGEPTLRIDPLVWDRAGWPSIAK